MIKLWDGFLTASSSLGNSFVVVVGLELLSDPIIFLISAFEWAFQGLRARQERPCLSQKTHNCFICFSDPIIFLRSVLLIKIS